MDFDLTDDQQEIKRTARELLAARSPWAKVREAAEAGALRRRAVARAVRARLAGHRGRRGARRPGARRGRAGRAARGARLRVRGDAVPRPRARRARRSSTRGSDEQRARWLPGARVRRGDRRRSARAELVRRRAPAPPWSCSLDGRRRRELVDGADGGRAARRDRPDAPLRAASRRRRRAARRRRRRRADRARVAVAAELVGVCQRALDMTLAYVKERKQFGVPVGSFQAVAHRCAQMLLDTEGARSTALLRRLGGRRRRPSGCRGGGDGRRGRGRRRARR